MGGQLPGSGLSLAVTHSMSFPFAGLSFHVFKFEPTNGFQPWLNVNHPICFKKMPMSVPHTQKVGFQWSGVEAGHQYFFRAQKVILTCG